MRKSVFAVLLSIVPTLLSAGESTSNWDPLRGPQGAWIYVVLNGYDSIAPKLLKAAERFGPDIVQGVKDLRKDLVEDSAKKLGIAPEALDLSKPFAIVVNNPLMGEGSMATLFPVKPGTQGVQNLVNGYAVVCEGDMMKQQLCGLLAQAGPGAVKAPKGIGSIYVNLGTIVSTFGPLLQMQLAMGLSQSQQGNQQSALAIIDTILYLLGQVDDVVIELDTSQEAIVADATVRAKPGTDLAGLCSNQAGGTALGALLGPATFKIAGKLKGVTGFAMRLADRVLPKLITDPEAYKDFRKVLAKTVGQSGPDFAMTYDLGGNGMVYDAVTRFKGTLDDLRAYYEFFVSPEKSKALKGLMAGGFAGMEPEYEFKKAVETINGVTVDRFIMKAKDKPESQAESKGAVPMEEQRELLKKMWGPEGFVVDVAVVGDTLIQCSGGADRKKRLESLIKKVKAGTSGSPASAPVVASFDLIKCVRSILDLIGQEAPEGLPESSEPIRAEVTFQGRTAKKHITVPLSTLSKLSEMFLKAEGLEGREVPPVLQKEKF